MAGTDTAFAQEFRRSWRILVVAFTCLLFAFSAPAFLMPFLYPEVIREFGWSREEAVFLASFKYVTGSVVAIAVGRFIDVIGVRVVLIGVSALGGLALVSFLWTSSISIYYAAGIMLGFSGAGTMVSIKVLISRAFHASQGTAMGIAMLGTSVGAVIVPLAVTFLIETYGWRAGVALLSSGVWVIALPLMIFFLSDKSFENSGQPDPVDSQKSASFDWNVAKKLASQRGFWLIFFGVFAAGFVDQAFVQHQVLYLREDLGMTSAVYASAISAIGLIGFVARPLVGSLFDKLSSKGVAISYGILSVACLLALGALNPFVFAVFIIFRAIGHSAVLLDTLVLAKHTFGLKNIGILLGIYTAAVNLGFAAGPPVVARLYSMTGSYLVPFVVCTVIAIVAAVALLPVKPTYWLKQRGLIRSGEPALVKS